MNNNLQKPKILKVETVARSHLFNVESVDLEFSNGERRIYERMRPSGREAVMIVPVIGDELLLIREYAVGIEQYELGFPKGLIDPGETVFEAANRELMEEVGFGAQQFELLSTLTMAPSYFSSCMNIVVANGLYPQRLQGDEPEPLQLVRWPLAEMMALLKEPDFREARNVSALFLAQQFLAQQFLAQQFLSQSAK
ncbi:ADP compounds hydrolase NudE [Dickeya chrysanthemi]|uniref:ADP compounds hydrolase NudE n=1 Tax=Dickeya chrysanthemi TaxID=556 RepID=UPI00301AEF36